MKMPCRQLHDVQVGPMRGRQPVSGASARALVSTVTQHRLWRSGEWTWFGLVAKRTRRSSLLRSLYVSRVPPQSTRSEPLTDTTRRLRLCAPESVSRTRMRVAIL